MGMLTEGQQRSFYCPTSGEALTLSDGSLSSSVAEYPILDCGVPCLYPEPRKRILEWGSKLKHFSELERAHLKQLQQLSSGQGSPLTRQRLNRQHEARQRNLEQIEALLGGWMPEKALPLQQDSQQIFSYFQLFFRDWCWREELQSYTQYAVGRLDASVSQSVLILGSGAGGLSCALANALPNTQFYSVEHNPLLAVGSATLAGGESLELSDYSLYPSSLDQVSKKWVIEGERLKHNNHTFVLGEYPLLPFQAAQFDTIIAPWFFDILDQPFQKAIQYSTRFLADDGQLLFMGPANVHSPFYEEQLCGEEIIEVLQAAFDQVDSQTERLRHLHNSMNSQNREEAVLFASARKPLRTFDAECPKSRAQQAIDLSPELQQYTLRLTTTLQILSLVDKDMSADELSSKLEQQFGFAEHESLHYAEAFIAQLNSEL